jgi:type IV fimbrial biogenesis protein FimT
MGNFQKAFTVIELLVVVAVIGIMSIVALPALQDFIERQAIKNAVEAVKAEFQFARTEALKRSTPLIVSRNTGANGAWCLGISTAACDCSVANDCVVKTLSGSAYANVSLDSVSANTTFDSRRGTANASNTCFSIGSYDVKVYSNQVGRTLICSSGDHIGDFETCASQGVAGC